MSPHPPRKDVTTTETVSDKDVTVTKRTRDHDELGKHVHQEVIDRVCPMGESHTVVVDTEENGTSKHSEVVDKVDVAGEVVHTEETMTKDADGVTKVSVRDTHNGNTHERHVFSSLETGDEREKKSITTVSEDLDDGSHIERETIEQTRETSTLTTTIIDETVTTCRDGVTSKTSSHEEYSCNPSKKRKVATSNDEEDEEEASPNDENEQ
eukprot:TRINITY_DN26803_c0_g1_i1.p1 TRINITY_DN26803_c0_g1~~TRINITY_DN26803_c0_g1_i1.p1  ORF type:complete len:223 (+),score=58.91 TRINITY_DN26803_c0_g1_i1:41-670(+)